MQKLLFGTVITMILISPALAVMDDNDDGCWWCPSWRSPASDHAPPWWPTPGPQGYSQDYIRRLTGQPPVVYQQAGEGVAVRAHVTHVPRLGRAHRVNER